MKVNCEENFSNLALIVKLVRNVIQFSVKLTLERGEGNDRFIL